MKVGIYLILSINILSFFFFLKVEGQTLGAKLDADRFSRNMDRPFKDNARTWRLPTVFFLNTPPINNQGNIGSCVGWGVAYTFNSTRLFGGTVTSYDESTEFSPSFIYNTIKLRNRIKRDNTAREAIASVLRIDCNEGISILDALNLLSNEGVCTFSSMPYNFNDCHFFPDDKQIEEAKQYKTSTPRHTLPGAGGAVQQAITTPVYGTDPTDVESFKFILVNSKAPIIIGFEVDESFDVMWRSGGIWTSKYGKIRGGHCICIIGYDDARGMFKCQNQWGLGGDKGFFWVSYNMIRQGCFKEAYYLRF